MNFRRMLSFLLAAALLLAYAPAASADAPDPSQQWEVWDPAVWSPRSDFAQTWAAEAINRWDSYGVLKNDLSVIGTAPNAPISRAEFMALLVRILGGPAASQPLSPNYNGPRPDYKYASRFADLNPQEPYFHEIAIACTMGVANGKTDTLMGPQDQISRQDAATMIGRALGLDSGVGGSALPFADAGQISGYAQSYVDAFVQRGWYVGYTGNLLKPRGSITRAEAAMTLHRIFTYMYQPETAYGNNEDPDYNFNNAVFSDIFLKGNLLLNRAGTVTLQDLKLQGDLIIGDGLGDGSVLISNSEITGKLIIRGGGINSVTVSNSTVGDRVYIASYSEKNHPNSDPKWIFPDATLGDLSVPENIPTSLQNHWNMTDDRMSGGVTRLAITDGSRISAIDAASGFALAGTSLAGATLPGGGALSVTLLDNAREGAVVNLNGVTLDELNIGGRGATVNLNDGHIVNARINGAGQNVRFNIAQGVHTGGVASGALTTYIPDYTVVQNLVIDAPNAEVTYANTVGSLVISDAGAVINTIGDDPSLFAVGVNLSARVRTFAAEGLAFLGERVVRGPVAGAPNTIDRAGTPGLAVELLQEYTKLPSALNVSMKEGRSADEVSVTQATSGRLDIGPNPKTKAQGYWIGFFIPAPIGYTDYDGSPAVTVTYFDAPTFPPYEEKIQLYKRDTDDPGRLGIILYFPVRPNTAPMYGQDLDGQLNSYAYINWYKNENTLVENLHFVNSDLGTGKASLSDGPRLRAVAAVAGATAGLTPFAAAGQGGLSLSPLPEDVRQRLLDDFNLGVYYAPNGVVYRGATAQRMILNTDNPLGLTNTGNQGLTAINRSMTESAAKDVLEEAVFGKNLTVDTSANSVYGALSQAGKLWVANQVLTDRKTGFATPAAVKAAFDKAVKARMQAESTLLNQINRSQDYAALRKIIEDAANAATLDFQTGALPYVNFPDSQRDDMAQYLHDRRPYPNIDAVIQAIKDYLGSNATPKPPEPGDYKNLKVALDPTEATLSVGGFVTAQLLVTGTVGDKTYNLTAADLDALGVTLPTSNSVTVSREGLTLTITGRAATRAAETLTFTVGGARGTMKVTVLAAVNASSISFKQRDITVKAGTTLNLWNTSDYLNLVPQGAVDLIWSSSDSAIATVNDRGMLTAVRTSPTPAVITVTTKGSGLTASVNVWVYENDWDIFIDPMRVTLQAGASTAAGQVRYITATPLTSTRKVVWRSLDATGMITVSLNGIITADARATQNANVAVVLVDASTNKDLSSAETTVALIPALGYNLVVSQAVIEQQTAYYPSLLQVRPVAGNTEVPDRFYWESSNPVILFSSGGSSPTQTIDLPSGTMPAIVTTGIGRSTITLRTTKDSVTKAAEDRYIISAPRGVSGMEFYENNSSTAMKDEPDYGRMITMVDETSTRVTAREPGQTGRELSWLMFETDAQRDRASLTSANSLLSYSNGILRATGMGLARIVVTPAFANLPAGWAQTAEDQRGRWYGRGSLPLFVLTDHDTDPDTPDVNVFNPLIDESLSGLLVKDSATGVLSPLNPNDLTLAAAVEEGTRIICDANGVEKTSASDWNPSDVPLVVKTADSSGSNELFVWIQPAPPIINPNVLPEETMTLSRYNSMIALAQSQTPNLPIISYEVVGDYTYDTVESGGTELSGPLLLAAWTQINGGGTERSADTGLNSIVFGRSPNNMLELSNTNLPRKLTFRAEIRYSTNRGFTNKLDPSDTEGKFITIPIPYTATNNPTVYSFTVTADTSFMAYVEIAKGGTLDLVDSPEVRSIASSAGINLANATFTTGNGPENIVLRNNSVVDVIGTGTATVIIVEGGKSMIVTINQYGATVLATGISLTPATHTMADGTTYALNAAVEPADATNRGITWATSDSTIATVSGGVVTAHNPGTVTITATSQANNAFFKTCEITVNKVDVTGIALSLTTLSLIVNGTQQLSVTFTPSNASDQAINWTTSDANVATVMNGLVTAVGGGTATITAASADLDSTAPPATCTVEVVATRSLTLPLPITPITPVTPLTPTTPAVTLREAVLAEDIPALQSAAKTAGIDPGTARYRSATADKLVIDSVGIAVAVAEGQAQVTITSSDGKKTAAAAVPVAKPAAAAPPKDLKLRTSASVGEKMTLALMPYFDVPNAAAELVWTSSNTSVLTVDQNGLVTGVRAGRTATVTATVKGNAKLTAKCSVTVRASKGPSAITMSKSALALEVGGAKAKASADLNVRRTPAKAEGGVTWLSSDETVARVDRNGRVTAVGAGTATVTAVSDLSGVTAVCAVTVTPAVTALTLNAKTLTMKVGTTAALTCTVAPQSAANAVLTYTSSNNSCVTVDAKGNLKALSAGTVTITVTAPSGAYAKCKVTVTK